MNKILTSELFVFVICAGIYNVLSTLLNWLLLYIGVHYLIATAVSYIFGVLLAYILNTKLVFRKEYSVAGCVKFSSVYISNFVITLILTFIIVDIICINVYIAPIVTMLISFGYNYIMSKYFVFREEKSNEKNHDSRRK